MKLSTIIKNNLMKKVLLVATGSSTFFPPIRNTFKNYGFEVTFIDYWGNFVLDTKSLAHRIVKKLPKAVSNIIIKLARQSIDKKILRTAKKIRPDCIFVTKGQDIAFDTLDSLRKLSTTVNYYPETMDQYDLIKSIVPHYTYFVNYDPYVVDLLKKEDFDNVIYIPFSADLDKNEKWEKPDEFDYNISFIGTFYPKLYAEREDILKEVKDLGLFVWGNKAWLDTELKDRYQGHIKTEDIQTIYKKSKIVINADISTEVEGTGVNLRPFEVTAAGAMLLNRDDRKDIFNLFKDGEEFISFSGANNVREKAKYYLEHEDERLKIAEAGFNRTRTGHTYSDRIGEILKIINI